MKLKFFLNLGLIVLIINFLNCSGCRKAIVYLIPHGYVGPVFIYYDQGSPYSSEEEDGQYLLRIPLNGILKTSTPLELGPVKGFYFFYIDSTGKRTVLKEVSRFDESIKTTKKVCIYGRNVAKSREWFVVGPWERRSEFSKLTWNRLDSLKYLSVK